MGMESFTSTPWPPNYPGPAATADGGLAAQPPAPPRRRPGSGRGRVHKECRRGGPVSCCGSAFGRWWGVSKQFYRFSVQGVWPLHRICRSVVAWCWYDFPEHEIVKIGNFGIVLNVKPERCLKKSAKAAQQSPNDEPFLQSLSIKRLRWRDAT